MTTGDKMQTKLLYTSDYEWVEFAGGLAYTGICSFKLTGFHQIHHMDILVKPGPAKQGDILVTITYNDYMIKAHMPVDGKIVRLNDELTTNNYRFLLEDPEGKGWIAEFIPEDRENTKGLQLTLLQYGIPHKTTVPINQIS